MDAGDPLGMGLISSLALTGTGMSARTAELAPKGLKHLRQIIPGPRRLGLFLNAKERALRGRAATRMSIPAPALLWCENFCRGTSGGYEREPWSVRCWRGSYR